MPKLASVSIRLDPKLKRYLEGRVKKGKFRSMDEAFEASVRSLKDSEVRRRETVEWLRREIAIGTAQLDRGESVDGREALAEIRAKLEAMRKRPA